MCTVSHYLWADLLYSGNVKAGAGRRADLIIAADTVVELHVISTPFDVFATSG